VCFRLQGLQITITILYDVSLALATVSDN